MNGFSQDLEETTMTTMLFRKVSSENMLRAGELCFSTEKSFTLSSHGEFCLVIDSAEFTGMYAECDADAGKNFGYDEFRVEFDREDLIDAIHYIVVPEDWFSEENEEASEWIENLSEYGWVISPEKFKAITKIEIDFNL